MTLAVAIASENDAYDGVVYEMLLARLLDRPLQRWTGTFVFNGCKSVAKVCPAFLAAAAAEGIRHALLAVDNDGGARRRPEHDAAHVPAPFDLGDDDGCRECWLGQAVPASFAAEGRRACVVVPVQAIETWLLVLRGHAFEPAPEHVYDRGALKRRFFGKPTPSLATRIELARKEIEKNDALTVLRARSSFQRFAERLSGW